MKFTGWTPRSFWIAMATLAASLLLLGGLVDRVVLPALVQSTATVVLPDVAGLEEADAVQRLVDLGLVIADVHEQPSSSVPAGCVVQQSPYAGATVKSGRRVYLTVSSGEETLRMPSLVGMSVREAQLTLRRLGLLVGIITQAPSDSIPADQIVYQSLMAGAPVTASMSMSTRVDLVMSTGSVQRLVPDVVGYAVEEARNILRNASISVRSIERVPSGALLPNTVVSTIPPPSEPVPADSAVILQVVAD